MSVYKHPAYFSLFFLDAFIPSPNKTIHENTTSHYSHLLDSIFFFSTIIDDNARNDFVSKRSKAMGVCGQIIKDLPNSSSSSLDRDFLIFLQNFLKLVINLPPNESIVFPGGWLRPESTHLLLYILRNDGNEYTFTVCNTGNGGGDESGLEYHPASFSPSTGKLERNLALSIHSIPKSKLTDSSFWSFLFRLQIYPSSHNGASVLYTKLLPSLNNLPLRANLGSKTADGKLAESYHNLALLAFTTDASEGANGSHFNTLTVMESAITASLNEMAGTPPGR